jgi:hypothetical protein
MHEYELLCVMRWRKWTSLFHQHPPQWVSDCMRFIMDLVCRRWKVGWSSQLESFQCKTLSMDFGGVYAQGSHQLDFLDCLCHYLRVWWWRDCCKKSRIRNRKFHCWSRDFTIVLATHCSLSEFPGDKLLCCNLLVEWRIFHDWGSYYCGVQGKDTIILRRQCNSKSARWTCGQTQTYNNLPFVPCTMASDVNSFENPGSIKGAMITMSLRLSSTFLGL